VLSPGDQVDVDLSRSASGRGMWLHPSLHCVQRAHAGLARSLRRPVKIVPQRLWAKLRAAGQRRAEGLLVAARRAGQLVVGADAVGEAVAARQAALVVVAVDAPTEARSVPVQQAVCAGQAVAWGCKSALGALLGKDEVSLACVLNPRLAGALARALRVAQMPAPQMDSRSVDADAFTEVR
jgi:ribosomal protein L7Ae-like RNA K-turn-binding protein